MFDCPAMNQDPWTCPNDFRVSTFHMSSVDFLSWVLHEQLHFEQSGMRKESPRTFDQYPQRSADLIQQQNSLNGLSLFYHHWPLEMPLPLFSFRLTFNINSFLSNLPSTL